MKNLLRLSVLLMVLGISLLSAAIVYPSQNEAIYNVTSGAHHLVFFTPGNVTIVITSLNQTAQLTVSPSDPMTSLQTPLLNISVMNKELVVFTVQHRGYYAI